MEIGDRVEMIEDFDFAKKGMTGKVIRSGIRDRTDIDCSVEFDQPFFGGHDCGGFAHSGRGHNVPTRVLKLLEDDQKWRIVVMPYGDKTVATLIQNGKCIKEVSVNRYYKDTHNVR